MPNERDVKLEDYEITRYRYRELRNFCLQYNEWRDELKWRTDALKSPRITGMPFSGQISDTTGDVAIRREMLFKKCSVVEQTLIQAISTATTPKTGKPIYDGDYQDLYGHLLKAITNEGISYTYLDCKMNIPIGRDSFYQIRRYFYFLLDKNKSQYY